ATETNYAAGIARAYNGGGFTDWFLPSKDELKQMSLNRNTINNSATTNGGVNFSGGSGSYWSSTETGSSAWALFFGNGHEQPFNKNTSRNVRAVRAVGFPAISSLTTITAEQAAQNTAIALKEDAANKSTDVTTDGASDVKFPTVKSVKTYVDNAVSISGNDFVKLTTNQTIAGVKTFSSNATFNGQKIGKGNATGGENLAVGAGALNGVSTGVRNTAIGNSAMQNYVGTSFDNNTSIGYANLVGLTTGSGNTSVGAESMMALRTGNSNTSIGNQSLINTTGNNNIGVGKSSGSTNISGNNNTIIGTEANVGVNNLSNASSLGYGAVVATSNTIQLGNTDVTDVKTSGTLTANGFVKSGGTATQFLMADGSVSTGAAAVREVADEFSATASLTSFTLTQPPSINSKVKMYVNGIRISNTAYSVSGTTLTYVPANNGGYALLAGDRIQFDYYY
ncbi:DUF1566 domain-containing protein, partial [uncultured Winogradskyella sp.]|uniref:Lcl domain-containing protein n=1 Tax=uncultured Winogradskyella sp. TaxID=395353 RepID=UPI0030DDD1BA